MSPEQVHGQEADNRADIYALGILLFECITQKQPFDGNTIAEILRKQALDPMPNISDFAPDLDYPEMDAVIQKATAKRREDRYETMLTFAHALSLAIPTQAHLGMSPLERSGRLKAIPLVPPEKNGTATALGHASKETDSADARTNVDLRVSGDSLPLKAPKSKGPLIGAAVAGALVLVGVVYALIPKGPKVIAEQETVLAIAAVIDAGQAPQTTAVVPVPPPVKPENVENATLEAVRLLRETNARGSFTAGRTSFENADLDAAETNLKSVEEGTIFKGEASAMLEKIAVIRTRLAEAQRLKASGNCANALGVFQEVLKLNPRVKDAINGISFCKTAQVEIQMP
jgi:eukaryotic-like serine/threonine-protein kinase